MSRLDEEERVARRMDRADPPRSHKPADRTLADVQAELLELNKRTLSSLEDWEHWYGLRMEAERLETGQDIPLKVPHPLRVLRQAARRPKKDN